MELWEVLRRRKMVRSFRQEAVPRVVLDRVLSSVVHAPSAGFTQGSEFLVLSAPQAVATYWRLTEDPAYPIGEEERAVAPPVVVLPMANRDAYLARYAEPDKIEFGLDREDAWPVPFWDVDCGMACMLVLLAAVDAGLGAWFSGIFAGEQAVLDHFGVPPSFRPRGVIYLGYAADTDPFAPSRERVAQRRRPVADLVHHDGW